MRFKIKDCIVKIEWTVIVVLIVSIISKTFRNYMEIYYMCFLFIIFHEMAHVFTGIIFQREVRNVNISICGLSVGFNNYMEYNYTNGFLKNIMNILIYASGPVASYILAVAFKEIKFVYEINIAFFVINLMPIYPLDGYNIIKTLLNISKNKRLKRLLLKIIMIITFVIMLFLVVILAVKYNNYNCAVFILYIFMLNVVR